MVAIEVVDVNDDEAFDEWYAVLRASATAGRTAPTVWTRDALAQVHRTPPGRFERLAVAAVDRSRASGEQVLGVASLDLPLKDDTQTASVEVNVRPDVRGAGVGSALWEWTRQRGVDAGRSVFQCEVNVPEGETEQSWAGLTFARARGFTSENVEDHLALSLPEALARQRDRPADSAADDDYGLVSWVDRCPGDLVESYARMRSLMNTDVPSGGMVRTARTITAADVREEETRLRENYRSLVSLARTAEGDPAGYTLVFVPLGDEDNLLQDDTYVMREHRGHRLGERLKWANLAQVAAVSPEARWLHTWTEQDNTAMQRTNADFGFARVEVMHEVQLSL